MQAPKRKQEESAYTPYRGCLIIKVSDSEYTTCRQTFSSMQDAMKMIDAGYEAVAKYKKANKQLIVKP